MHTCYAQSTKFLHTWLTHCILHVALKEERHKTLGENMKYILRIYILCMSRYACFAILDYFSPLLDRYVYNIIFVYVLCLCTLSLRQKILRVWSKGLLVDSFFCSLYILCIRRNQAAKIVFIRMSQQSRASKRYQIYMFILSTVLLFTKANLF